MLAINCPIVSFADGPETIISNVPSMVCLEDWIVTIVVCAHSLSNPILIVGYLKVFCIVNSPVKFASLEKELVRSVVPVLKLNSNATPQFKG